MEDINMKIYNNNYSKEEDDVIWELHEIRHRLHKLNAGKALSQINQESLNIIKKFKKKEERKGLW